MYRTDADGAVVAKPARPAAVDPVGYFDNGTVVDYGFLNDLMDEVCYAVTGQGYTLDRADPAQLLAAIQAGLLSSATPIAGGTTDHLYAAIIANSCVIASPYSAAIGSQTCVVGTASSEAVLIAMSESCNAVGDRVAIVASFDCDTTDDTATNIAILASNLSTIDAATAALIAASYGSGIVSGGNAAIVASSGGSITNGFEVALLATVNCTAVGPGAASAIVGSSGCSLDQAQPNVVILASSGVNQTQAAGTPSECVMGGTAGSINWRIASASGTFYGAVFQVGGADFAELFENAVFGVIPAGTLVARVEDRVFPAQPGDRVIGVVSSHPAVLGNATMDVPDPLLRTAVGLTGRLVVMVADTVLPDDFLQPGPDGVAVASPVETRIEVMKLLAPGTALCLVR